MSPVFLCDVTSYRKVVIGGTAGARTVRVAKVGIVDESAYETGMELHGTR